MNNKAIAEALLGGKRKSYRVTNFKLATAIRVAGHRLGGVLTIKPEKSSWRLVKSTARVWHKKKKVAAAKSRPKPKSTMRAKR